MWLKFLKIRIVNLKLMIVLNGIKSSMRHWPNDSDVIHVLTASMCDNVLFQMKDAADICIRFDNSSRLLCEILSFFG